MKKATLITFICTFTLLEATAQELPQKSKELTIGLGAALYNGDLGKGYQPGSLMGSIGLKLNADKKLHGNLHVIFGSVTGQELDYEFAGDPEAEPNTYFSSSFFGVHYELAFNLIAQEGFKLYLSQGIGFFRFQPKDEFGNKLLDQPNSRDLNEDYRNISFMLPTQLGGRYTLENGYSLGLQIGFLNPLSDYVDNISTWGGKSGNDNILTLRVNTYIPIHF